MWAIGLSIATLPFWILIFIRFVYDAYATLTPEELIIREKELADERYKREMEKRYRELTPVTKEPNKKYLLSLEYYKEEHWIEKKNKIIWDWAECDACTSYFKRGDWVLHHKHYDTLGYEQYPRDIVKLCHSCHNKVHFEKGNKIAQQHWQARLESITY